MLSPVAGLTSLNTKGRRSLRRNLRKQALTNDKYTLFILYFVFYTLFLITRIHGVANVLNQNVEVNLINFLPYLPLYIYLPIYFFSYIRKNIFIKSTTGNTFISKKIAKLYHQTVLLFTQSNNENNAIRIREKRNKKRQEKILVRGIFQSRVEPQHAVQHVSVVSAPLKFYSESSFNFVVIEAFYFQFLQ